MSENRNMNKGSYIYTRKWFDFAFENPHLVTPVHTALYLWLVELNNRLGWAKEFAAPACHSMQAIGIRSYNTFKKAFDDLLYWNFIQLIEKSKNQYSANIIALSNFDNATEKALDTAIMTHGSIQVDDTSNNTGDIIKQQNSKKETDKKIEYVFVPPGISDIIKYFLSQNSTECLAKEFEGYYCAIGWMSGSNPIRDWQAMARKWIANNENDHRKRNKNKALPRYNAGNQDHASQSLYD